MDESRKQLLQHPTDVINGFQVRPGYYILTARLKYREVSG